MKDGFLRRAFGIALFLALVAVISGAVWQSAQRQALDQLGLRGQADLALASDRLVGQLQRYRDLAVVMADHPQLRAALSRAPGPEDVTLLQRVADTSAARDVMVLDTAGRVRVGGTAPAGEARITAPYVRRALQGALGWGHGADVRTERAFFHAAPIFGERGKVVGAVLVVTDLNGIDYSWRGATPAVFFTDAAGAVQISNRSELIFWQRPSGEPGLIPPKGPARPFNAYYDGPHEIWTLDWSPYLPRRALHLTQDLPVIGLTGEVLLDVAPVRRLALAQAGAVAALCLAFGALLFLATERRRTLARANAELEARVASRTAALRETNQELRREAAVREEAQLALRRAQDDLVQASKLSALGQMSAGISHELNQPLMATRSFAENAVQFLDRGRPEKARENLGRISDMAERMARIIRNLRAFARQESGPQGRAELGAVLASAIDLTRSHIDEAGVTLDYLQPQAPIWVQAGEVRLGQVFVNLITNAVDAMQGSDTRRLVINVEEGAGLNVTFRDSGPGIEVPDKVFDPFYTTKSGDEAGGMGLGLSISYGIVQSFGGQIHGKNVEGGALFTVTLERAPTAEIAA